MSCSSERSVPGRQHLDDQRRHAYDGLLLNHLPLTATEIDQIGDDRRASWHQEVGGGVEDESLARELKRIESDLVRLYSTGFFKSIRVFPEPGNAPGRLILTLNVEEQKRGLATIRCN